MSDDAKRAAGRAAADQVEDGMRLGLGTGSTVAHFLDRLAERGLDVAGVPTSRATEQRCRALGITLLTPADVQHLDLCVDGADELTRDLVLTKGGGGALLREKVVATMSERMLVIATPDKVVERLADTFALPVEVVPFAVGPVTHWIEELGFHVARRDGGGTDNGNLVLDCHMPGGLDDPEAMDAALSLVPGIAEHGLFVELASGAILGREDGTVETLARPDAP
jgi:ribose 5-phosphate isomerase A